MAFFLPRMMAGRITDISPEFFKEQGIRLVILDVDNTLTTHGNPLPAEGVPQWLEKVKEEGIFLTILSNNTKARVEPFAAALGVECVSMALKPFSFGITRAMKRYGVAAKETALIGDQIFTDMIGGNVKGVFTVLVEPYAPENGLLFRLKRRLEQPLIRRWREKGGEREWKNA